MRKFLLVGFLLFLISCASKPRHIRTYYEQRTIPGAPDIQMTVVESHPARKQTQCKYCGLKSRIKPPYFWLHYTDGNVPEDATMGFEGLKPQALDLTLELSTADVTLSQQRKIWVYPEKTSRGKWKTLERLVGEHRVAAGESIQVKTTANLQAAIGNKGLTNDRGRIPIRILPESPCHLFTNYFKLNGFTEVAARDLGIDYPKSYAIADLPDAHPGHGGMSDFEIIHTASGRLMSTRRLDKLDRQLSMDPLIRDVARNIFKDRFHRISLVPADNDSRWPLRARITLTPLFKVPAPESILAPHFTHQEHLKIAVDGMPRYLRETREMGHGEYGQLFLYPGKYKIALRHPDYYYLEKTITVSQDQTLELPMDEKGSRHRVQAISQ
ncbi:MAG: hypothetical protein MI747_24605 [Desulfobacterales bacterium]|nr:hypothetical protein [Desulfobacterales bacterium]